MNEINCERRKHKRFAPREDAYAALGRRYTRVGKIKDISLGGLAFEYIGGEEVNQNSSVINIFLIGLEFLIDRMPSKLIYNIEMHVPHLNNNKLVKMYTTKRCGVKFENLTRDLTAKLKFFLKYHTRGATLC